MWGPVGPVGPVGAGSGGGVEETQGQLWYGITYENILPCTVLK